VRQLQDRLDSAINNNNLSHLSYGDIEPFLGSVHAELCATAARIWDRKEEYC
jgi:hypothetical protein